MAQTSLPARNNAVSSASVADPAKNLTGAQHMGGLACATCAYMVEWARACPPGKL